VALLTWIPQYSVNVREIDEQHKKLIGLINQMYDAMRAGKGRDVLGQVLAEIIEYTDCHFSAEERLFRQSAYPEDEEHCRIHEELTRKAREFQDAFDAGNTALCRDVMLFLSNWLNIHILEVDKTYKPYLAGEGVREENPDERTGS
jgi:hemerythrin